MFCSQGGQHQHNRFPNPMFLNEGIRIFELMGQITTHATEYNNVEGVMSVSTIPNFCFGSRF